MMLLLLTYDYKDRKLWPKYPLMSLSDLAVKVPPHMLEWHKHFLTNSMAYGTRSFNVAFTSQSDLN